MGVKEDRAIIEASLYAADRPLTLRELCKVLGTPSETYMRKIIEAIKDDYERRGGALVLSESTKDTFALNLRDELMPRLEGIVRKVKPSRGALKTLALIAFHQPIQQAKLVALRGGRTYEYVKQLIVMGFVDSKPLGRTRLLRPTTKFARYYGLPDDMEKMREEVRERLEEMRDKA